MNQSRSLVGNPVLDVAFLCAGPSGLEGKTA